tara:strand:+ start:28068 stop:28517 length:450 start_codon:yes stop_codon:yes gene_type:complete
MSGQLTHSPGYVVRKALVDLTDGTLPSASGAWPIHTANMPNKPDSAILITETAGKISGRDHNSGTIQEHQGIQIMVRASRFSTAYTKAGQIIQSIDEDILRTAVTISSSTYEIQSITRTTGALNIGKEEGTKRQIFTINAIVSLRETTT